MTVQNSVTVTNCLSFIRILQHDFSEFLFSEVVDNRARRTFVIVIAAAQNETAFYRNFFKNLYIFGVFGRNFVSFRQCAAFIRFQKIDKIYRHFVNIQHVVFDAADERKMHCGVLVVEFRPQSARRIQHIDALLHAQPLFCFRDAGTVARYRALTAAKTVDKRRFSAVRNADDHRSHGGVHALFAITFNFVV